MSLWLPAANLDGLAKLSLKAIWAGVGQGRIGQDIWRPIALLPGSPGKRIEFPTAQDQPVPVGQGRLPAGGYQRVFVAADEVLGMAMDGQHVRPANHVEPIALPVRVLPGTTSVVVIELTVERQSPRRGGTWQVFVKDACLRNHRDAGWSSVMSAGLHAPKSEGGPYRSGHDPVPAMRAE